MKSNGKLQQMRAAVLYGKEDVRIEDVPEPVLKAGEVRISIQAALTCGTDLKVYKRGYHARMIVPPAVFGHEMAGTICEVHPETGGWSVGERVVVANSAPCGNCFFCRQQQENLCDDLLFLNGAYAESIAVPARLVEKNMLRVPANLGFREAAMTEPFACVVQGVAELQLKGHEHVLVLGSGPIGLMFVALARHLGCDVTLGGRGSTRLALAKKLGAETIEISGDEIVPAVHSSGKQFDVVIEAVGKPVAWEAAVRCVRKGGKVNFFGGCPSGSSVQLDTGTIHYSNLTLLASFHHTPTTIRQSLDLIREGVIRGEDFVNGEASLNELPELFRSMAGQNRAVKTLIRIGS